MREIKFRVFEKYPDERFDIWDSASGDWRLEFDEGHKIKLMIWHYEQERWIQSENEIEVYEFTGLKDRNGKEIYEGDLLRYPPKDKWEETNFVEFEVFYHDNDCADNHVGFQMNRIHFHGSIGGYSMLEKFLPKYTNKLEVIGNVYTESLE